MRIHRFRRLAVASALAVCLVTVVGSAIAHDEPNIPANHGISLSKGCTSPTPIGSPYTCTFTVFNITDDPHDTLTIHSLVDVIQAAEGPVTSPNILPLAQIKATTTAGGTTPSGATCTAAAGDGITVPYTGVTSCSLPFGSRVHVLGFSFYTVKAADLALPGQVLTDAASLEWHDLCDGLAWPNPLHPHVPVPGGGNCNPNPPPAAAASQALIEALPSTTTTVIHDDATHAPVLVVPVGTKVHDSVSVSGGAGNPTPTGTVTLDWFPNGTCTGSPLVTSPSMPLVGGSVDATDFAFTVNQAGFRGFKAHFTPAPGSPYLASDGPCEPLQVVDARIAITPNGTNPVGSPHDFTAIVQVNDGTGGGFAPAPAGTSISFTKDSGPGSFTTTNPCLTVLATGSCTITLNSQTTGTTVVSAHSTVSVAGVSLTRDTNGVGGNSGAATKQWVDANIAISPATANNPVGTNHLLTITVNALGGTIAAGPHTATASIVSGPGSFVGSPQCTYTGGAATATCTVTITSASAGTTTVSATSAIPVGGVTIARTTGTAANSTSGGSGNAAKNWADSTIVTNVRNAGGADVTGTTIPAGTVVHDEATVGKTAGTPAAVPAPTGTVSFTLYNNGTCNGTVIATDPNKPLVSGVATSVNFTAPDTGGSYSYRAHYNGDANYPARDAACEPFSVSVAPPGGLITHTNVDCGDVRSGAAANAVIDAINYPSSGGKIGQGINPGKFYFWTQITTTVPNQVVKVTQTNTSANNAALFEVHQGWARIYTANCSSYKTGTEIDGGSGASFTVSTPGTYFIGIKYDPKSIVGKAVPVPATVKYEFKTTLGGSTGGSVLLRPNP